MRELLAHAMEHAHLQAVLRYEDRSAMALSLENRVPLLTSRLAHFALSLPESCLISARGERKHVLREAMRGIVPDAILDRRDKIGFAVPITEWLVASAPWVERKLQLAATSPVLSEAGVRQCWNAVQSRGDLGAGYILWRCLALVTWLERCQVRLA